MAPPGDRDVASPAVPKVVEIIVRPWLWGFMAAKVRSCRASSLCLSFQSNVCCGAKILVRCVVHVCDAIIVYCLARCRSICVAKRTATKFKLAA
jgi:hypothetical protein